MKTVFRIERPDDVQMVLTVTMTLGEWRKLQEQLSSSYPSWRLSSAISEMVLEAKSAFYPSDDAKEEATGQKA